MKLELTRVEQPFRMVLQNANKNELVIDAASTIGGSGNEFRPMELLAGSLASCMAIDILNILKKQRLATKHFQVTIQAERKNAVPSPFDSIELEVKIDKTVDEVKLQRTIDLTLEKYCSVAACLSKEINITTKITAV